MAVAVLSTELYEMISYPSCKRKWLKTAVQRIPARNQAAERIDETDLFRWQVDDAERITATGIMINISKQHAEKIHGIKNWGDLNVRMREIVCIFQFVDGFWSQSKPVRCLNSFGLKAQDHQSAS